MIYQLDVMAHSVADAVDCAGGLICDRALAGWQVRVFSNDCHSTLPLKILGADTGGRHAPTDPLHSIAVAVQHVVAMPIDLVGPDGRVSGPVRKSLAGRHIDMLLWGLHLLERPTYLLEPAGHDLSAAARAFKARAALVAGLTSRTGDREQFWAASGVVDQQQLVSLLERRATSPRLNMVGG